MGREENLKPYHKGELSKEEAKVRGSKGGKASGKARREKKKMKDLLNMLLALPVSPQNKVAMERLGINAPEDQINKTMVLLGLIKRAEQGDPRAVGMIAGLSGEFAPEEDTNIPTKLEFTFIDATHKEEDDGNDSDS